jgi:hypothetical protein
MLRLAIILAAIGMVASVPAFATTIFSETFASLTPGPSLGADNYSQRAYGDYRQIESLPGWSATTLNDGVYAFEYGSDNFAVLLNEGGHSISQDITGLAAGQSYDLQFEYWGDNRPEDYSFYVTINNATTYFNATGVAAPTGAYYTVDIPFVATGTSTTLTFHETSQTEASPIFDNIQIDSVPEPVSFALFGSGLVLVSLLGRKRFTR